MSLPEHVTPRGLAHRFVGCHVPSPYSGTHSRECDDLTVAFAEYGNRQHNYGTAWGAEHAVRLIRRRQATVVTRLRMQLRGGELAARLDATTRKRKKAKP